MKAAVSRALVVSSFSRTSGPAPATYYVRFQGVGRRREDDGVDEAADGFSGLQNTRFHFFPANGQAIRAGALVTGAEA